MFFAFYTFNGYSQVVPFPFESLNCIIFPLCLSLEEQTHSLSQRMSLHFGSKKSRDRFKLPIEQSVCYLARHVSTAFIGLAPTHVWQSRHGIGEIQGSKRVSPFQDKT